MARRKTALITGVTGQDGALLARFLLARGYVVHGMRRYDDVDNRDRVVALIDDSEDFHWHYGEMTDGGRLYALLYALQPDEIYNLAALSHVQVSFDVPEYAGDVNALGTLRLLEAIRTLGLRERVRFYQASSSEMFGNVPGPQNEETAFQPCSPYGAAKLYAYWLVRTYREAHGLFATNGILFNHESALRGEEFVTQKIVQAAVAIQAGRQEALYLGNLDARRDWGHAADYVAGMWLMMQQDVPDDFVLATGKSYSVRDAVAEAFACCGIKLDWQGQGLDERGINRQTGQAVVAVDPAFFRPADIHDLIGDATKARRVLGWQPEKSFHDLIHEMVSAAYENTKSLPGGHHLQAAE